MPQGTPDELSLAELLFSPTMFLFWSVVVFLYGCIIGSFLNVAIYRLPLGMSVNNPKRSFCFRCGTPIRWHDNIPVLGFLILRGRDRACGAPFSPRYAFVEFLTGSVFLLLWLAHNEPGAGGFSPITLWYMIFAALLIVGTFTDFDHWIVPASIPRIGVAGALVAALLAGFFDKGALIATGGPFPFVREASGDWVDKLAAFLSAPAFPGEGIDDIRWWEPLANAVVGAIVAPLAVWGVGFLGKLAFRKDAMGFGDVELFAMIGATAGPLYSLLILVVASFYGSIAGGIGIARARMRKERSPLALGELSDPAALTAQATAPSDGAPPPGSEEEVEATRDFAESLEMEFVDLREIEVHPAAAALLPAEFVREHLVFPLDVSEERLRLAVRDPNKTTLITELRALVKRDIEFVVATESQLRAFCGRAGEEKTPGDGDEASGEPLWQRYYKVASVLPLPRPSSHLPFIPWIALACLTVVAFHDAIARWLTHLFVPHL